MTDIQGDMDSTEDLSRSGQVERLYSQFPGLLLQNRGFTSWSFAVSAGDAPLLLKVQTPSFPSMNGVRLTGDARTELLLSDSQDEVEEMCRSSGTMALLLTSIENFLQQVCPPCPLPALSAGEVRSSAAVLQCLEEIGWDRVHRLAEDLSSASVKCTDGQGSLHTISFSFPRDFPAAPAAANHSLPPSVWQPPTSAITLILESWQEAVNRLGPSWAALHELDRLCWVLDPDPPLPSHLHRRLVVAPSVSLHLTIDPAAPSALPDMMFLGADQRIAPLRAAMGSNLELWEEEEPLLTNLERLLDIEFPAQASSAREDWGVECGICYSYRLGGQGELGGELPTQSCEDSRCCQPFHPTCLFDWLQTLPGARVSLDTVHGECPYCTKAIQCPRPETQD